MLLKLDENLGRSHVELLRNAGHEADRVHDEGLSGEADSTVWERVCAEGRFFITLDLDFADIRRYQPRSHHGILLLRARSRSRPAVLQVLEHFYF
jgi:predicted nuclease of predicted toxin-antitoxin system